ncbi:protein PHLOEM PROTEIN 2-LIKE A1-like [Pyrus communis]|uniref:protein PHLOEM PROTEIN 2-LIKE A1-like n=1 Tax=Pyrus communis TaxID=23211 RepID=UPI0035BFA4F1
MANNNGAQEPAAADPHNYKIILENFGARIDMSSPEKVRSELRRPGIFDQQKTRRYWVDDKGRNCFMVYARALTITFADDSRYWRWHTVKAASDVKVEVAELLDVLSLNVHGTFETRYLTPETYYEVSYVITLKDPKYGWEDEVDFSLTLPQNRSKTRKCDLRKLPRRRWSYVRVGEFKLSPGQSGHMEFTLNQIGKWKKGLLILGVDISPKI